MKDTGGEQEPVTAIAPLLSAKQESRIVRGKICDFIFNKLNFMTPGLGARTVRSLALVAEVIHGAPCRFTDPARFAMSFGGPGGYGVRDH